jgi:hypothetical protein
MAYEKDPAELGALWMKESARGAYMTGTITVNGEAIKVVCFSAKKTSDKSPDWRVLKSVPKDARAEAAPVDHSALAGGVVDDSDVPFAWLLPLMLAAGSYVA